MSTHAPTRSRRRVFFLYVALLGCVLAGAARHASAGSFIFAGEANGVDVVAHPKGYTGASGTLTVEVCIVPGTPNDAAMVTPLANMVATWNALAATTPNLVFGGANNIPATDIDWESVALHELGHCIGLGHPNVGNDPGVGATDDDYTKSTDGANNVFNFDDGADNLQGSNDDTRTDDINLNWFRIGSNNPFTALPATIDSTTWTRGGALPGGHTYSENADRDVGTARGFADTEAVLQQGSFSDEDQRRLQADDVAQFRIGMSGLDLTQSTAADNYTINLVSLGISSSAACDITVDFDNSTGFAVCGTGGTFLNATHIAITTAAIHFNTGFSWFFNPVPSGATPTPGATPTGPTPTPTATPGCPEIDLGSGLPVTQAGSTSGAANAFSGSCGGGSAPERSFKYTAPLTGIYTINTIDAGTLYDTVLYVRNGGCGGAELACNDDVTPLSDLRSQVGVSLTTGQMIAIFVDGFGTNSGNFVLHITPPGALDDFTCYQAKTTSGTPKFPGILVPPGVSLVDQFGSSLVAVKKPNRLCVPTQKNLEPPPANPQEHLKAYQVKPTVKFVKVLDKIVSDQFGTIHVNVLKPTAIMLPTAKSLVAPLPPLVSPVTDHFQCYQVKDLKIPTKFQPVTVTIADQFGSLQVLVQKPKRLCAPVDKNGEDPTAPSNLPHLMCYQVKDLKLPKFVAVTPIFVNNQFGPGTLDAKKPAELCVPALKN